MTELRRNNIISPEKNEAMKKAVAEVRSIMSERSHKAHIMTFGCQQNTADSERLAGLASAMGYTLTDSPDGADLILVNTCAVREHAEKKALSVIGQLKHRKAENPEMIIGIGGCMVSQQHRADTLKRSYPYVDFSFCTTELYRVPELILSRLSGKKRYFPSDVHEALANTDFSEDVPVLRASKSHAWVSIMYGCNNFCSYCIVPYVRGRERSRLPEAIIKEVTDLVNDGCLDITLLGQNVNSYGHDLDCGVNFAELLKSLSEIPGDFRLRFMTSHPKDATTELIDVIAGSEKISRHFHLPMQSGSDEILRRMNRRYNTEKYMETVRYMREKMPDIVITSDIIVGFPGETNEDFEGTLEMLKKVRFDMIYAFMYSPRSGTPAAKAENQVPEDVKKARFARLVELQNSISEEKNSTELGKTLRVLTDDATSDVEASESKGKVTIGRTDGNKLVRLSSPVEGGKFILVKITDTDTFGLSGTPINI